MSPEKILIASGSVILFLLGALHLRLTFFSNRFSPRNADVEKSMQATSPRLTSSTTMWNCWIGFNASHSLGAIYFGTINLILSLSFFNLYRESVGLNALNLSILLFYLFLARKYWFRIPFTGIALTTLLYTGAIILILLAHD